MNYEVLKCKHISRYNRLSRLIGLVLCQWLCLIVYQLLWVLHIFRISTKHRVMEISRAPNRCNISHCVSTKSVRCGSAVSQQYFRCAVALRIDPDVCSPVAVKSERSACAYRERWNICENVESILYHEEKANTVAASIITEVPGRGAAGNCEFWTWRTEPHQWGDLARSRLHFSPWKFGHTKFQAFNTHAAVLLTGDLVSPPCIQM